MRMHHRFVDTAIDDEMGSGVWRGFDQTLE